MKLIHTLPFAAAIGFAISCVVLSGCKGHNEPSETGPPLASLGNSKHQDNDVNAHRLYNEGVMSYRQGDYETALIKYKKSISLSYSSLLQLEIVRCLDKLGKVQEADSELETLMTRRNSRGSYQTDPIVLLRYGQALERGNKLNEAKQLYRAILSMYKPSAEGNLPPLSVEKASSLQDLKAYSHIIAAIRSKGHGDSKSAFRFAKLATEISPQLDDAHLIYADLLDGLDQNAEAISEYKRCSQSSNRRVAELAKDRIEHIQTAMKKSPTR